MKKTGVLANKKKAKNSTYKANKQSKNARQQKPYERPETASTLKEVKSIDYQGTMDLQQTAELDIINDAEIGTSFYNRTGRRIKLKSLFIRVHVQPVIATRDFNMGFNRVAVVYDRQTNGSLPSYDDIFTEITSEGLPTIPTPFSKPNLNNRERFTVLMDYQFQTPQGTIIAGRLSASQPSVTDGLFCLHERYIDLKGLTTQFSGDDSTIADIATGSLLIVGQGSNLDDEQGFAAYCSARLRFWDG